MPTMTMSIEDDVLSRFVDELCTPLQRTVIEKAMQKGTLAGINYNVSSETVDVIVESGGARVGFRIDRRGEVTRAWQETPAEQETVTRDAYDLVLEQARELAGRVANLEEALRVWYHATLLDLTSHLPEDDEPCSCEFCVMTREVLGEGCPL
jgi:hypothetical protein